MKKGRRSARNPRRVIIDAVWKAGETWAVGEINVDKTVLVQEMSTEDV